MYESTLVRSKRAISNKRGYLARGFIRTIVNGTSEFSRLE